MDFADDSRTVGRPDGPPQPALVAGRGRQADGAGSLSLAGYELHNRREMPAGPREEKVDETIWASETSGAQSAAGWHCGRRHAGRRYAGSVPNDRSRPRPVAVVAQPWPRPTTGCGIRSRSREGTRAAELFIRQPSHRSHAGAAGRGGFVRTGLASQCHRPASPSVFPPVRPTKKRPADSVPEIRSILVASGVPAEGIVVTELPPFTPNQLVPVVLEYPKIVASAGPCGRWPKDLGPGAGLDYMTNEPYWNLGCSTQAQSGGRWSTSPSISCSRAPKPPPTTARRDVVLDKYKKGESPATVYPRPSEKSKVSDVGQ